MPFITGFTSTNVWIAFIFSSFISSLIILIAITVQLNLDKFTDVNNNEIKQTINIKSLIFTLLVTFIASMIAYSLMYFIFGYGKAMVVNS